jgi:hypothetical protein
MENVIVRAVDSGNIQRSPTFQAVFNHTLSKMTGLPKQITFDGAGIDVDKIMRNATSALKKLSILDAGLYYDLIKGGDKKISENLINRWFDKKEGGIPDKIKLEITKIYSRHKTSVHSIQMKFRNDALIEAGISKKFLPGMRVPFSHHKDLRLLLPVERSVVQKLEDYYQSIQNEKSIQKPEIIIYGDLVGTDPLPDELKGGMEIARKQVKYFMDTCEIAMEKIINIIS